jgi:hypothetical protein
MNMNLLSIVNKITAQYGEDILDDSRRLKALFSDLAKDEPKLLRRAFGKCVESGFYRILKNTATAKERREVIESLARRLRDEEGLDIALCAEALEVLAAAIFGEGQIAPPSAYSPPPVTETVPRKPASGAVQAVSSSGSAGYGTALMDTPPTPLSAVSSSPKVNEAPAEPLPAPEKEKNRVKSAISGAILFGGVTLIFLSTIVFIMIAITNVTGTLTGEPLNFDNGNRTVIVVVIGAAIFGAYSGWKK